MKGENSSGQSHPSDTSLVASRVLESTEDKVGNATLAEKGQPRLRAFIVI